MRHLWLLISCSVAVAAVAQQPPAPPPGGDVFSNRTRGGTGETPLRAFTNLYQVAAEITGDPSAGYDPQPGGIDWPYATDIQKQWRLSVSTNGKALTAEERKELIPCAANLNAAIDAMQRGYRIEISQKDNPAAQQSVQKLYGLGRAKFALCDKAKALASNDLRTQTPDNGSAGDRANAPLKGKVSNDSPGGVDTGRLIKLAADMAAIMKQLESARAAALKPLEAARDTAVFHFLDGLVTWAEKTLTYMKQKPGVPLSQGAQAIAGFLTAAYLNDDSTNAALLQAGAEEAVKDFLRDPARFLGENLPNFLPLPKLKMLEQVAEVEKGAERLAEAAQLEQKFVGEVGANGVPRTGTPPEVFGAGGTLGPLPCAQNACVSLGIAQDALWAAGETYEIRGAEILNGVTDLRMEAPEIVDLLRSRYGSLVRRNPNFTPAQKLAFRLGIPIEVKPGQMEGYLGPWAGSRGLVFVKPANAMNHVINVRELEGGAKYWDAGHKVDGRFWLNDPIDKRVFFYPTN